MIASQQFLVRYQNSKNGSKPMYRNCIVRAEDRQSSSKKDSEVGFGLKAVWVATEQLGNIIGLSKGKDQTQTASEQKESLTREEVIQSIRNDYDVNYFVTGKGDMRGYDDNCRFADPFASFRGLQRFKNNVSNLGSLMEEVNLTLTQFTENADDGTVTTKWRFSCYLSLPWRPLLAAAGGTTHVLDESTNLVVDHIEDWDVEPGKVLMALLKPGKK